MEKNARAVHFALCIGSIAFFLTYALPLLVKLPQLWYLPVAREWAFGEKPALLSMDWYGRTLGSVIFGSVIGILAYVAALKTSVQKISARVLGGALLLSLLVAVFLYYDHLIDRQVKPEPLPSWYQPR